jgi:proline iminopeptidase
MIPPRKGLALSLLFAALTASAAPAQQTHRPGELFPVAEPLEMSHLKVSEIHSIAYGLFGNREGEPVFVLHGGPGAGCYPRLIQYFNPEKFFIVLHDQRGAGRSTPPGELRENTTWDLVEDIERLRKHLKIDGKMLVFGGSWGSTLALAYAEKHPESVFGMVLRGIFTGTDEEIDNTYSGTTARLFFPDTVARWQAALPPEVAEFQPKAVLKLFTEGDPVVAQRVAKDWIRRTIKTGKLHAADEEVTCGLGESDPLPGIRIGCHYAANCCFFEEGQLLREIDKIKDIPITIINGRYDMICPPVFAWRLHQRLPKSKLIIVEEAGHSEAEPGITRALVEAVAEFE